MKTLGRLASVVSAGVKPTQVRIEIDVEKLVRRAMAQDNRTMQAEVNRALRIFYSTTAK